MKHFDTVREPNICEIERRLWKTKEYMETKQYSKAKGCINSLWHTITELAENIERDREALEYHIETVRRNAYKDPYYIDMDEMQGAVDSLRKTVAELKGKIITRKEFLIENKYSDDELSKAWEEYLSFEGNEAKKEYGEHWEEWMDHYPQYLPSGTTAKGNGDGIEITIPIRNRDIRDSFSSCEKRAEDFLKKKFGIPCRINYDYAY